MKVSEIIIYIIKIMWSDLKKNRFQDRENENTPKFPSIEIWY